MSEPTSFRITYASMFTPNEELHAHYEQALARVKANLGKEVPMLIDGRDRTSEEKFEDRSPTNTDLVLGTFQRGTPADAEDAIDAASRAFPTWSRTPWQERVALIRKAADILEGEIFDLAAMESLEVGKNRTEALGDVSEMIDLFRYACDQMEANSGYALPMGQDPIPGYVYNNVSVLRPYGVWVVISPFNFPCPLTGGPLAHALVAGNTVVFKPSSESPWPSRLIAEGLRDAGLPAGVFNYVTGPGGTTGQALTDNPAVAGITFTGSYEVGMSLYRDFSRGKWARPIILELGGKNPAIVSRHADIETAATGIIRSAFGLQGQKCSAASRVYVEAPVYESLVDRLVELTRQLTIGDPTDRSVFLGPVINRSAYENYQRYCDILSRDGKILCGGAPLTDGEFSKGYFCAPTIVADLPLDHPIWETEMFLPITTVARVANLDEAMREANKVAYGLTAGFYGSEEEAPWFFDHIEAGVAYVNRPQGATTGAWPGFQPFGGWKGSGATGKNSGGVYYLPLYMREQIQTLVRKEGITTP